MKKALVIFMALALLLTMGSIALAKQEANLDGNTPAKGNIVANEQTPKGHLGAAKDYAYKEQGEATSSGSYAGSTPNTDNDTSTHVYGTWNSPYTLGIDGYNYNDSQDYTDDGDNVVSGGTHTVMVADMFGGTMHAIEVPNVRFESGPHGGYLTSTHRCRECHAVHRAAGKFKLLRSDTRFEACDWCHGTGAGSGFNIQMDNDDNYTTEYNVGHTMGYGIESGKWKAPDDTYPAFTPNYWQGGFSCFDCHSPHANPQRLMGFDQNGVAIASILEDLSPGDNYNANGTVNPAGMANGLTGRTYNLGNPGHDLFTKGGKGFSMPGDLVPALGVPLPKSKPYYFAGSWLLIKNPDREISQNTSATVNSPIKFWDPMGMTAPMGTIDIGGGYRRDVDINISVGQEIADAVTTPLNEFSTSTAYPVNKVPTDWNNPIGSASAWDIDVFGPQPQMPPGNSDYGYDTRNPYCRSLILDEFCTDCHDGNAGFHTQKAPLFSEDRALRNQTSVDGADGTSNFRGYYDLAYGHDSNVRH